MASSKRRRKDTRQIRKQQQPQGGVFRHRDGDRRRRGAIRVEDAIKAKRAMQQPPELPLPDGESREGE